MADVVKFTSRAETGWSRRLHSSLEWLDRVMCWLLIADMAVMLVAATLQVLTRYVFEATILGPGEVAKFAMVVGIFIALPVLTRHREHVAVDAAQHYLPSLKARMGIERVVLVLEAVFLLIFAFYGFQVLHSVSESGQFSPSLGVPMTLPMSALVVGPLLGTVATVGLLAESFILRTSVSALARSESSTIQPTE